MNYESTFICSPEASQEKVEELTAKVTKLIESSKGEIKTVQQMGKRKFAYPVNKFREGSYVYIELNGTGETVGAIENFYKLNDSVLRFLTVKVEKKKVAATKPATPIAPTAEGEVKTNESTEQPALA